MRTFLMIPFVCLLAAGCHIEITETGEWDEDAISVDERAADVCDPYCIDLIECGVLSETAFSSCQELCVDRFMDNETGVTEGCACVQAAQCNGDAASHCEGDPLPGVLDESDGPNPEDGSSSGGGDYSVPACETNHECALGEDCVDGSCATRCVASCQCDEGQACTDGYCGEPSEPAVSCADDCDCTSGQQCVEGACQ